MQVSGEVICFFLAFPLIQLSRISEGLARKKMWVEEGFLTLFPFRSSSKSRCE